MAKLLKYSGTNNHTIDLVKDELFLYRPIHNLRLVELESLKIYIKINVANNFIELYKSLAFIPALFVKKPNSSLRLYIDHWGFNKLTIMN